jgi:SAM-dependent methyltransferase
MAEAAATFGKMDIINTLAARFGYRRYLEFATRTTGLEYRRIDRGRFAECRRLLYNMPDEFADGLPIDYRAAGLDIAIPLAAIAREGRRFDVILVDPYHEYQQSRRDLETALALLAPGGALVVHDCLPPNEELAQPHFREGAWCGVTYKAFVDFVIAHRELRYVTVDTDYGCGIVRKAAPSLAVRLRRAFGRPEFARWRRFGDDYAAAWRYFAVHHKSLLDLIDVDVFRAGRDGLG